MKIFLGKSITCNLNYQPYYIVSHILNNYHLVVTNQIEEADVIVFPGTCSATVSHIEASISYMKQVLQEKKPSAVSYMTGCLAREFKDDFQLQKVENWLEQNIDYIVPQNDPQYFSRLFQEKEGTEMKEPSFGAMRKNNDGSAEVYISNGCLRHCAFCKTTFQSYPLQSTPLEKVEHCIDSLDENGYTELSLIGTNISQYGIDFSGKYQLPKVISYISKKKNIKNLKLIGFSYADAILGNFTDVLTESPQDILISGSLESGSDPVLQRMHKGFTSSQFLKFVSDIRRKYNRELSLNIISGFPMEQEEDIERTLEVLELVRPRDVQLCRYIHSSFALSNQYEPLAKEEIRKHTKLYVKGLEKREIPYRVV